MADEPTDGSEDELMAGVVVAVDGGWSVGALPPLPTPSAPKRRTGLFARWRGRPAPGL